tara:strand:+ start:1629 stop:1757 length:129 start_codon:yes stop_codon:yes gene_type:complete
MKLYWRYKKDGKWSWKAANVPTLSEYTPEEIALAIKMLEEEE